MSCVPASQRSERFGQRHVPGQQPAEPGILSGRHGSINSIHIPSATGGASDACYGAGVHRESGSKRVMSAAILAVFLPRFD